MSKVVGDWAGPEESETELNRGASWTATGGVLLVEVCGSVVALPRIGLICPELKRVLGSFSSGEEIMEGEF